MEDTGPGTRMLKTYSQAVPIPRVALRSSKARFAFLTDGFPGPSQDQGFPFEKQNERKHLYNWSQKSVLCSPDSVVS